ncbi:MAG TPA: squalene/phytoene synthase family protein [Acetobacteraceae bacterium]|nr:squalene/phytoene synthase family protein [Acetobacteraceae bacterium]
MVQRQQGQGLNMAAHVRACDPDRFFAALFAPAAQRDVLLLLYAFNHELARAREVAREPMLALIRLQWWREVVEGADKPHEIATPLRAAIAAGALDRAALLALVDAREIEAEPAIADWTGFLRYVRATAGQLAVEAARVLGVVDPAVSDLGTAYGIAGILRAAPFLAPQGRCLLPADGTGRAVLAAEAIRLLGAGARLPRAALPAVLPAALVRRDLARADFRPRLLTDRLAMLTAKWRGRVA